MTQTQIKVFEDAGLEPVTDGKCEMIGIVRPAPEFVPNAFEMPMNMNIDQRIAELAGAAQMKSLRIDNEFFQVADENEMFAFFTKDETVSYGQDYGCGVEA
jgi:hypothetical protein